MIRYKKTLCAVLFALLTIGSARAQNGSNSPYTRYGFGQLSDQNLGGNKGMGGIGIGLRDGTQVNVNNPASYTAVDSLTFLFEVGISLQNANFSDGQTKLNAKNSSFDYLAMQFRLFKKAGMTVGFLPYSNVGYSFNSSEVMSPQSEIDDEITATRNYSGDGGLHQAFIGVGYKLSKDLSIGLNASYLFGNFTHKASASFSDANMYSLSRTYYAEISDVKLDFGAQYTIDLDKKRDLIIGATYSWGHDLNANHAYVSGQKLSGSTVMGDTVTNINKAFQLPHSFGLGATYVYDNKLTVGADFSLQKFGNTRFFGEDGQLADRLKCSVGMQYLPNSFSRNYLHRVKYRAGAYYSDPYVKVNNQRAAREYGIGGGLALPIQTGWGWAQKAILNISGEWVKIDPKVSGLLKENYLRLSVGLTFNERWFQKQKVR